MEIEKALAGTKGNSSGDSGTTKRAMAQFLKFLSDERPEGVYIIATCNDISSMAPEFLRAERWDCAPFFIDLPNDDEKEAILDYYRINYQVFGTPIMNGWSGAEIKSCCRMAAIMDKNLEEVEQFIVPISSTMESEITALRKWAVGKTIPASTKLVVNKNRDINF